MHYWDASALVPLCLQEASSPALRRLASRVAIVTWCLSAVEIASAVERRAREGALDAEQRGEALANLTTLAKGWVEVEGVPAVRERALRVLATHSLRAADAIQLGAALVLAGDKPTGHSFVCADQRLRQAASREGFTVLDLDATVACDLGDRRKTT